VFRVRYEATEEPLTPEERLRIAFELADAAEELVRARLRRERPTARAAEIERAVDEWYATRPGAEHGDAEGEPGRWPRRDGTEPA
jgi:hypothetical protein